MLQSCVRLSSRQSWCYADAFQHSIISRAVYLPFMCCGQMARLTTNLSEEANSKWPMANRTVTRQMTSRDPERSRSWHNMPRTQYLENSWRCYFATIANYYSLLWGSTVGYPSNSLASCKLPPYPIITLTWIELSTDSCCNLSTCLY